ncbi:MAG TPA: amidohydrolase family protein [Terracidiphilus sp.]|nr:amidohydrolase family protein [Terracidiphilus sp.]
MTKRELHAGAVGVNHVCMLRLDSHQHFWKYSSADYGWIDDAMLVLKRDFLPADLVSLLKKNGLDGSIAVQARQSLEETRWLLDLARENDFIRGVVGWVDLRSPQLNDRLDEFAGDTKLVGVRHVVQDEPDDQFMLQPEFRHGIAQLARYGLVYDLLLHPRHLPIAVELVREFPAQSFVLDHIAKPPIAAGTLETWSRDIRALAQFPNVACKLSGMVTEARWHAWKQDDFTPYLDVVAESFGPSRLMIGSDWPVCTLSADYETTMQIVRDRIAGLSAEDQDAILGGNCARIYRRV